MQCHVSYSEHKIETNNTRWKLLSFIKEVFVSFVCVCVCVCEKYNGNLWAFEMVHKVLEISLWDWIFFIALRSIRTHIVNYDTFSYNLFIWIPSDFTLQHKIVTCSHEKFFFLVLWITLQCDFIKKSMHKLLACHTLRTMHISSE